MTGGLADKRLHLLGRYGSGETTTLMEEHSGRLNRGGSPTTSERAHSAVRPHGDDDDARLRDDILVQLVEGGVRVVVEALQLLAGVVQVDVRPEGLGVRRGVDRRRVELQDAVILTLSLLHKLSHEEKQSRSDAARVMN